MTDMILIDRDKLVDAFAKAIAEAEPAVSATGMIDVRSIAGLAEKGRELAAAGAFRNKTIYSETVERLDREGYSEAEVVAISEIGLQVGRAVNAAFMNAAGVYSGTAKLLRAFEKEGEAVTEQQPAIQSDVEMPPYTAGHFDEDMAEADLVWDEPASEAVSDDSQPSSGMMH